jgi:adenylate kinase
MEYASKGQLVPDEPTIQLWLSSILGMIAVGRFNPEADTLLLDGIPRNPRQVELMSDLIEVKAIFNLFCPHVDKLVSRLQRRALKPMNETKVVAAELGPDAGMIGAAALASEEFAG